MEKTKQNVQEKQQIILALEAFGSENFLSVNKKLLSYFGPELAVYIGNLVDKMQYFFNMGKLKEDNSFFLKQADQAIQTGMSEYQLRKCKNKLKKMGILTTQMRGIPPKEFYILHIEVLLGMFLRNIPKVFKGIEVKKLKDCPLKNFRNIKENKDKENKDKENKDNISLSGFKNPDEYTDNNSTNSTSTNMDEHIPSKTIKRSKPTIEDRNKQYLPLAKRLYHIIRRHKKIKYTLKQIKGWANEIRLLVEQNGISQDRIEQALDWYKEHIGEEYIPVIESGSSLRNKFIKLEDAMARCENGKHSYSNTNGSRNAYVPEKNKYAKALARRQKLEKAGILK